MLQSIRNHGLGTGLLLTVLAIAGCGEAAGETLGNEGGESLEEVGSLAEALTGITSPAPLTTFKASGTSGTPPDTMGAVGPNHVVTIINFRVIVQTRAGVTLSDVDMNQFFSSVLPANNSTFDPRAAYDPFANRFILTAPSGVGFSQNSTTVLAVSETSDPTGAWRFYAIPSDPGGLRWADHNGLGLNSKWIVIHANMIPFDTGTADYRQHFFVINKAALYSNTLSYQLLTSDGWQSTPAMTYDAAEPDLYLLETQCGNCGDAGVMRLRRITGPVGSPTMVDTTVTTAPWGGALNAPQQGSSALLDFAPDWIQNVVVRNGSVWATHQIGMPASAPTHTSVRWIEIDPSPLGVVQQGTIDDPSGANFFGLPSIAVNSANDALVGYTRSSLNQFPSANYSARDAADPLGTMRDDLVYKAGEAAYGTDGVQRWGDYTNTVVDPVGGLNFWTIQQIGAAPASNYALWWAQVPAPTPQTGCTVATAQDLGPRTTQVTVASNACVKVSQYPSWWQFTNGLVTLQSGTGTFPVPATWTDSCTQATAAVSFTTSYQSVPIGNHTASCPVVIKLNGGGSPLQLTWW